MGREVQVVTRAGKTETVVVDAAFVRISIADPNAAVRVGYPASTMPALMLDEAQVAALLGELKGLSGDAAVSTLRREEPPLWPVILCTAIFVFGHLLLSSGTIRRWLVGVVGEGGFQAGYSVLAIASISGMFTFQATGPHIPLWPSYGWMPYIPIVVMPFVMVLWVAGYSTRNATAVGQTDVLEETEPVRGIGKITRHPANCGFGVWALTHLVVNGDLGSLIVFGGILFLAIFGTWHIERRRRRVDAEAWARLTAVTSVIPFVALVQGRTRVTLKEIGYTRIAVALGLYAVFLTHLHDIMMSKSPLPW